MTISRSKIQGCKPFLGGCLSLAFLVAGCGSQAPPDTRAADASAIKDLDAQWSKAAGAGDLDGTVSYYADDASLLPPDAPIASSKAAIRSSWEQLLVPGNSVSWQASSVEVARSSDLAYSTGTYRATLRDAQGNPMADRGKYVEVWKKQADGKWKVVADMYNSDLPPMAPPPQEKAPAKAHSRRTHPARHVHGARHARRA